MPIWHITQNRLAIGTNWVRMQRSRAHDGPFMKALHWSRRGPNWLRATLACRKACSSRSCNCAIILEISKKMKKSPKTLGYKWLRNTKWLSLVLWLVCADLMLHRVDIRALGSNAQTSRYNTCIISLKSNGHCDNWHALHVQWSWLFIQLQCEIKRSPTCTNKRRI